MKTKNLLLGLIAFVFAVGSAFASLLAPANIWVKARLTSGGSITCVDTQVTCANSGAVRCTVTVPVQQGSGVTSSTYRNSGCTVAIFRPESGTSNSSVPVFELIEPSFIN
jgi:hypothetical protein